MSKIASHSWRIIVLCSTLLTHHRHHMQNNAGQPTTKYPAWSFKGNVSYVHQNVMFNVKTTLYDFLQWLLPTRGRSWSTQNQRSVLMIMVCWKFSDDWEPQLIIRWRGQTAGKCTFWQIISSKGKSSCAKKVLKTKPNFTGFWCKGAIRDRHGLYPDTPRGPRTTYKCSHLLTF